MSYFADHNPIAGEIRLLERVAARRRRRSDKVDDAELLVWKGYFVRLQEVVSWAEIPPLDYLRRQVITRR